MIKYLILCLRAMKKTPYFATWFLIDDKLTQKFQLILLLQKEVVMEEKTQR